jgi:hypothetical protein
MPIQYAGGTIVNAIETAANLSTKTALVDWISAQLVNAGWTRTGSSGNWNVTSDAAPPFNLRMRVNLNTTPTNCAGILLSKEDGSQAATTNLFLLPNRSYRIIANRFQAFVFTPGAPVDRGVACWGVPAVPSYFSAPETAIWGHCNATSDTDSTAKGSFRLRLGSISTSAGGGGVNYANYNNSFWTTTSPGISSAYMTLFAIAPGFITTTEPEKNSMSFSDSADSFLVTEPLIAWHDSTGSFPAKIRGQLWDAILINKGLLADTTFTFDGRTYWVITNANNGSSGTGTFNLPGTLCVAVT